MRICQYYAHKVLREAEFFRYWDIGTLELLMKRNITLILLGQGRIIRGSLRIRIEETEVEEDCDELVLARFCLCLPGSGCACQVLLVLFLVLVLARFFFPSQVYH